MAVVLGPILQFRGAQNKHWLVSALVVCDVDATPALTSTLAPTIKKIAALPFSAPAYHVYRIDMAVALASVNSITIDGRIAMFKAPADNEAPRSAYVSCNGFSSPKLMKNIKDKNERWKHLQTQHAQSPYHLLMMGGDQLYSDSMWDELPSLHKWASLPLDTREKMPWSATLQKDVDKFFCKLYLSRWAQPEFATTLASIPALMMWDDHDIMDGWGSYPEALHLSPVFQGIFALAKMYFRTLQLQLDADEIHPLAIPDQAAFNLGCADIGGGIALLALDLRSERQPLLHTAQGIIPDQVMAQASASAVYRWLDSINGHRHLVVMSSIPVCYLNLGSLEKLLGALPGQQELEDDLRDHWRSPAHQGERKRLIHNLLDHAGAKRARVTLLSGDVHVAALAVLQSERAEHSGNAAVINQLISSGVVHPAPPSLALFALEHVGAGDEQVDRDIVVKMQPIANKGGFLVSQRNWLALEPDAQSRLWANWHLEGEPVPITKVIHPVAPQS
jgi:hypothetical protein